MARKRFYQSGLLLCGLGFVALGIAMLLWQDTILELFPVVAATALFVVAGLQTVTAMITRPFLAQGAPHLFSAAITVGVGVTFLVVRQLVQTLVPIVFSVYILLLGIVRFILFFQSRSDRDNRFRVICFITGISMIFFSVFTIARPLEGFYNVLNLVGGFLILYGFTLFSDLLGTIRPRKSHRRRHIRITLPVIWEMYIPHRMLSKINRLLEKGDDPEQLLSNDDRTGQVDLEIFVHVRESGTGAIGHADVCFEGTFYSYGNYDASTFRFRRMYGDGVLYTLTTREEYIRYSQEVVGKTLFAFGLQLSEEQKEQVRRQIESLKTHLIPWDPPAAVAQKEGRSTDGITDNSSLLYLRTDAKFYKFQDTSYKTYFTATTSCMKLVDELVGSLGSDILGLSGVVTPGTYFEYLNREYERKGSQVISRKMYVCRPLPKKPTEEQPPSGERSENRLTSG